MKMTIKRLYILSICFMLGFTLKAQPEPDSTGTEIEMGIPDSAETAGDTTVIKFGDMSIVITNKDSANMEVKIEGLGNLGDDDDDDNDEDRHHKSHSALKNVSTRYFLFNMGINGYLSNGSTSLPAGINELELNYGKSIHVDLYIFQQRINIIRHYLNLVYGLSLDFNNYKFQNPYTLQPRQPVVTPVDAIENWKKSKLATTFVSMPLMLNIETNPHRKKQSLHIGGGVYGGYMLGAHTKQKATDGTKLKEYDDFNVSKFRYGLIGQLGFGWFKLYGKYSMVPLFNENEGPELTPFSIGLILIGF